MTDNSTGSWRGSLRGTALGLGVVLAVACTPIVRNTGYVPTETDLAAITVGADTRETITAAVGPPTTTGVLGDQAWFYVQSRFETRGAAAAVEVDRQVVAISFSAAGTVSNVERFTLEDGRIVTLSRRVTTDNSRDNTFLRQLLGSVGRVNAQDVLGEP
ncbi:Beta-barrel assembly machine subunit BamE [Loktanella fryxellensis]|uniref:Beta-barrel assembly machine subunit BamE n=1 Tax=Loktanella fryxellensis TaxID=245187 RepID=A0A1H7Y977_9RHOB|nr:outer membrane protein assembly factor BamE [Loktanella fryxellensis]SEM42505.1 Beta-barrel assembly machine subunit BamE [Loktanella fryxellensis]